MPIGNLTSQFLANVYLNPLDHFVKQEIRLKGYLRYMDDFVCFHESKSHLKAIRREIEIFLEKRLALQLKDTASYFGYSKSGLSFLGARIFLGIIRIKPENLHRVRRRMRRKYRKYQQEEISEKAYLNSMNSYWAFLASFDGLELRQKLLRSGI